MGRKTSIAVIAAVVVVVLGVGGAYAYDSSQKDKIAEGVTIAGVDVGGLDEDEAAALVRKRLLAPLRHSLRVSFDGESWELPGAKLKVRADVDEAVEEARRRQPGRRPARPPGPLRHRRRSRARASRRRSTYSERAINQLRPPRRRGDQPRTAQRRRRSRAATRSKSSPARTGASCATTC